MERVVKSGNGWRIGYDPLALEFKGLVGTDDWAIELTAAEFNDFCRLFDQLTNTVNAIALELMDEEKISLEAETDLVWLEISGYPHAYSLRFILNSGRGVEGLFPASIVSELANAIATLQVF